VPGSKELRQKCHCEIIWIEGNIESH